MRIWEITPRFKQKISNCFLGLKIYAMTTPVNIVPGAREGESQSYSLARKWKAGLPSNSIIKRRLNEGYQPSRYISRSCTSIEAHFH